MGHSRDYFFLFFWDIWHKDVLRNAQGCLPVLHMSLIILIITVGAANHLIYGSPPGGGRAEPTPDMQSKGKRFGEWVKKTERCRQWAGFAWLCGLLLVNEFSFFPFWGGVKQIPGQHKAWVLC